MELSELLKSLFESYGAAALPWSVMAFLGWLVIKERWTAKDVPTSKEYQLLLGEHRDLVERYQTLADKIHDALVECARSMERLSVLFEERTRARRSS